MKTTRAFLIFLIVPALVLTACNNKTKKDDTSSKSMAEEVISNQDIKPEIEEILYQFPTPFEVTVMLEQAKAGFIFDITNPVENIDKYMTEQAKALNLGVYSADLSYAAAYNRSDETKKLMEASNKLSDELGISGVYNQDIISTIKNNYDNKDSLVTVITDVFDETKNYLSDNNRDKTTVLIVTGGFVETMYIASSLNLLSEDNQQITNIIFDQEKNLDKLLNVLSAFNSDEEIKMLSNELKSVKKFFDDNPHATDEKISNEKATEVKNLTETVRNKIVK